MTPMPPRSSPPADAAFAGFPKAGLTFLRQLARHNDRDWFAPRKADYEQLCRRPMELLVAAVNERLVRTAVEYAVADPRKAVYRIYRDTRFSKDKTPYKTHVAAYFGRKGYAKNAGPGFYVQVSPAGFGIAGGLYMPGPDELRAIRTALLADAAGWERAACGKRVVSAMGEVQGSSLTRAPKGFESAVGTRAEKWVRMKQWYYWREAEPEAVLSPLLVRAVAERIEAMLPMCEWLHAALLRAGGAEEQRPVRPEPMF